ncbi:MAG TPA: acyl-CoA dehydrogenase family protein, partial [Burkholderiales bacterium]|nr:acyl-CoA dehydrogenase family protein [Burkholderiales bacterium]
MSADHAALLKDSVSDFIARGTSISRVRALRGSVREYDRTLWRQIADLGWLGIAVPERHGGMGLGLAETAIVAEGLARSLAPEPYTACAVLAAGVLIASDNDILKSELLPAMVSGERVLALAWQEEAGVLDSSGIALHATSFEGGYRLNGSKRYVSGAAGADTYLVAARSESGLMLACMERDSAGVTTDIQTLADGRHFTTLTLRDVFVPGERIAASGDTARAALERALDHATAIASAELYGVMSRVLEMSVEYMKTRVQFGKPIGSFQALQHRAVDLHIQKELSSAVLDEALAQLEREPDAPARAAIASRAKARCSDAGVRITREAIQIHGAIGFTDEYDAGLYLKRALVLAAWLGNAAYHRR